jgi:hypothetical protein
MSSRTPARSSASSRALSRSSTPRGGGVYVLRLYLSDLPSRAVVSQLPRDLLISVGLSQIVLPALGLAGLYAIARLLAGSAPAPKQLVNEWDHLRGWRTLLAAAAVPALAATTFAAVQYAISFSFDWHTVWFVPVTLLVTLLIWLTALNLRARLALRARKDARNDAVVRARWNERSAITRMTLIVAFAALPFCIVLAATIKLNEARVCLTNGSVARGDLIGETSDRTYIGQTKSDPRDVFSVPTAQITKTIIGGQDAARCPHNRRIRRPAPAVP